MKKIKTYLTSLLVLFSILGYSQKYKLVIGKAINKKGGAFVIVEKEKRAYFLDGIDYWDDKILSKIVKVRGLLLIEDVKKMPQKPGLPIPQQIVGLRYTILKPKWTLVK